MDARPPDPDALRYARHWEPVLVGPARRLLARVGDTAVTYLDVGAGTGSLALAAAVRWPSARIVGLDASAGMLSVARHRVANERGGDDPDRFEWLIADAADMPIDDSSVDAATSAFMLQLVPDRPAVLREVLRVLRPGGVFGLVTWIAEELFVTADDAFEDVLSEMGVGETGDAFRPPRTTDYRTLDEVAEELLAAGFTDIDVEPDELRYAWTRESYLVFKEQFDEHDAFESLDEPERARLRAAVRKRWADLPAEAFTIVGPLVLATARRPSGSG